MKRIVIATLFTLIITAMSFAQTPPPAPQYVRVQVLRMNPGMDAEWHKFYQTEILPVLKKGGVKQHSVWRVRQGDVRQYFLVTPLESLSQLDEPGTLIKVLGQEAAIALNTKQSRFLAEWRLFTAIVRPDLGIAPTSTDAPKLAMAVKTTVTPGRAPEWEKYIKESNLVAAKKAGSKGVLTAKVGVGGDTNEYHTLLLADSYADGAKYLEESAKVKAEMKLPTAPPAGVIVHTEILVVRYVPELSIRPEPPKAANK